MSSNNIKDKKTIILFDLSSDTNKEDIELFLSEYKNQIESIQLTEKKPYKASVTFKENKLANECRINMNQKKLKKKSVRIVWEEKDFLQKNKDNKNNLYIKNLPKNKNSREIYEFFIKFGDIFSIKINEDEQGNNIGTGFLTYYKPEDAKKAIDETNGKKIWDSDMEVHYQKCSDKSHNTNDNNMKINIVNLPENYTDQDLTKLCEEFGKIHICNYNKKGKSAIVKYNSEQEAKNAMEKLNNKVIDNKKIYVKEVKENHYFNYNYNYNNNYNNKHNFFQQNYFYFNNPMIRYEESFENNKLYVKNIPHTATEEDLQKLFGKFGKIISVKLEKDISEKKDDNNKETKIPLPNKGFGYISFEKVEDARNAYKSLNGTNMPGFDTWPKPLFIDYYIPKDRRDKSLETPPIVFPAMPGQFSPYPMMIPMAIPNNYNQQMMWNQGNYKNMGYNNNFKYRFNKGYQHRGRGGHRYKNYQKKNIKNEEGTNNINSNSNITNNNTKTNEEKNNFDYESFKKLTTIEEKKEFLGERIFTAIQNSLNKDGDNNIDLEIIGKITGMIIEIPNEKEIIEILEKPSVLDSRVKEALSLLNTNK
jgi:RNA recognition motif-containing protein